MKLEILRLSHRIRRDPRLSTHVALTARAFLASKLYYSGDKDSSLESSINKVTKQFGGDFRIEYVKDPIRLIQEKKKNFTIIHLTMYGLTLTSKLAQLKKSKNLFVIIGGEKVPPEIFQLANFNISITQQPISEVSALAIFLHEYLEGKELKVKFPNAKIQILPSARNKKFKK